MSQCLTFQQYDERAMVAPIIRNTIQMIVQYDAHSESVLMWKSVDVNNKLETWLLQVVIHNLFNT